MAPGRQVRLTTLASCAGWAAKMGAEALTHVLRPLTESFGASPDLLVGLGHADDAAVYRLDDERAIVATVDFFPPVVDDPWSFGAVAAANALSDIYAMGGQPLLCLNLVAFPDTLDPAILTEILRGGAAKVREAGAVIAGGHSVVDAEPKYGLAAIGTVHPSLVRTKGGARIGDALLLTKPVGTGVITTAAKRESVADDDLAAAVASMTTLNAAAARVFGTLGEHVHACTDITGFGLLGHTFEVASQSGVGMRIHMEAVPLLPGAARYAAEGMVPGGTQRNRDAFGQTVRFAPSVDAVAQLLLFDPQTSGGLFAAIAKPEVEQACSALAQAGVEAAVIGEVIAGEGIEVVRA